MDERASREPTRGTPRCAGGAWLPPPCGKPHSARRHTAPLLARQGALPPGAPRSPGGPVPRAASRAAAAGQGRLPPRLRCSPGGSAPRASRGACHLAPWLRSSGRLPPARPPAAPSLRPAPTRCAKRRAGSRLWPPLSAASGQPVHARPAPPRRRNRRANRHGTHATAGTVAPPSAPGERRADCAGATVPA
jgi:hypothetical protein